MYLQQNKLNTKKRNRMTQLCHFETAHNQAGFDKPFINERSFICLSISKMSFTF